MENTQLNKPVDIWMTTFQRKEITEQSINFLKERTDYPYRLFVIDNHSTDGTYEMLKQMEESGKVFLSTRLSRNIGIHMAHNIGLALVSSDLCISTDNDIFVPDLRQRYGKCWLTQLVELMETTTYDAIACKPHAFIGAKGLENAKDGVFEVPMCGAVMRIMRTKVIRKIGGWDYEFNATRNHEEKTICSRIQSNGGRVGYAQNITCYHDFGDDNNWGYKDIPPHDHGHRIPGKEIWPPPEKLQIKDQLDYLTWERL